MNQTQHTPASPLTPAIAWRQALQAKLMAALDAAWAMIEGSDNPVVIRAARDRAKAIGDIAAMVRKVALIEPPPKAPPKPPASVSLESLAAAVTPMATPVAAQAEHARRALDKLKGGRRGRL